MKKSRDTREIFAVFKQDSFMAEATFWEKFRYWFKNVYWYHFRIATFAVIAVGILAIMLVSDVITREYNDLDYILAGAVFADTKQMQALSDHLGSFIPAESAEGQEEPAKASVGRQMLSTESVMGSGDQALAIDEYNAASIDKISISMADDEILLFFFDRRYAEWYAASGAFEPLSVFGIAGDNEYYVRVDEIPFIKELGISHNDGIYAAIKVKNQERKVNERIMKKYENAALALSGLLAGS